MKEYLKKQLNEQQYKAALHLDTASLILAGAGSGKTRTLIYKVAYMLQQGIPAEEILAVTFTNKASNEMKERLQEIWEALSNGVANDTSKDDVDDFDSMISDSITKTGNSTINIPRNLFRIGTFHSIFLKVLKKDIKELNPILDRNYNTNFNIYDMGDIGGIIRWILKDLHLKDSYTPREVQWHISRAKNAGMTADDYMRQSSDDDVEIIGKIYAKYEKQLWQSNSLDFDDLLLLPHILFKNNSEVLNKRKSKFKYILVDEAQDSNKIQFELMHMLSGSDGNITLIWDDFQSIYWWRWAVIEEFLNSKKHWPALEVFKLEINYRSAKTIVEAGNAIIANNKNQFKKNLRSHTDEEEKIKIIRFDTDIDEAIQVIDLIQKFKEEKKKKWSDFAILYRMNAQSQPFEQILLTENIPYKIWWGFKFYERKEVKDILAYIKYMINPNDAVSLERIINVPNRKIWATSINKMKQVAIDNDVLLNDVVQNPEWAWLGPAATNNIKWFTTTIKFLEAHLSKATPAEFIKNVASQIRYEDYMKKQFWEDDAKEKMENIWQLINTASTFDKLGVEWLLEYIGDITLMIDLEERSQETPDSVQLMTVHASKWLEFNTVFIVWLEENIFPLPKARMDPKELEEERRLMYVAITRSKKGLVLTHTDSRRQYWSIKYNSPSRFLKEIPVELCANYASTGEEWKWKSKFNAWENIKHKLFGPWKILEIFENIAVVKFLQVGVKKIDMRFLDKA